MISWLSFHSKMNHVNPGLICRKWLFCRSCSIVMCICPSACKGQFPVAKYESYNISSSISVFVLFAYGDCRTYRPTNPNITRTMAVQISWESGGAKNNLMPPLGHMPNRFRTACVGWGMCPIQNSPYRSSQS